MDKITFEYMDYANMKDKSLVVDVHTEEPLRINGNFVDNHRHGRIVFCGEDAKRLWEMLDAFMKNEIET